MQNGRLTPDEHAEVETLAPYCCRVADRFGLGEDGAQEAILAVCQAMIDMRGRFAPEEFRAYLTGVAFFRLCALSRERTREAKRRRLMPRDLAAPSPVEAPDLLDAIPDLVDRDVAHRVWVEGQSIREVARARGVHPRKIGPALRRAAECLRRAAA